MSPYNPPFIFNNENYLCESNQFWQRTLKKMCRSFISQIKHGTIEAKTNISSCVDYVPCQQLLDYFENIQIFKVDVVVGQITTPTALPMDKFRSLNREVIYLRQALETAGLI